MFLCLLIGGLTVGLTVGLLDVLVFHLDAISSQKTVSAGVDLALGLLLLVIGALVATGRLRLRRKAAVPAGAGDGQADIPDKKKDSWARLLAEPRLGLAMLVGAVCGIPGAAYLSGLHILITSKSPAGTQVIGVILFVLIEFLLIIIPFAFLEVWPEATKATLKSTHDWLLGHARQLMAYTALVLGAYLTVSALVRLA
jgi:Sap-like sulfolipid-1-addressing protein